MSLRVFSKILFLVAFFPSLFLSSLALGQDELILTARATLYTNREKSIRTMEDAVEANPDRVDYRVELVRYLDIDSEDFFADLTSLVAIKDHPSSGELLVSRIELTNELAADLLPVLKKTSGQEAQIREIEQMLSLGVGFGNNSKKSDRAGRIAQRLIDSNRWSEADAVLAPRLKEPPYNTHLLVQRVMVLAQLEQFQDAIALQNEFQLSHRNLMTRTPWLNWGMGDLFLKMNQPEIAADSFRYDEINQLDERIRLVLFAALKLSKKNERAAKVFESCKSWHAKLVEIGVLLKLEDNAAADKKLAAWLESMQQSSVDDENQRVIQGSYVTPNREPKRWPSSLLPLIAAARKHIKQYVDDREDQAKHLVTITSATKIAESRSRPPVEILGIDEKISRIKVELEKATQHEAWFLRNTLAKTYAKHSQFDKAAAGMVENALGYRPREYTLKLRIRGAAVDWSLYKRKAQTISHFLQHPAKLTQIRRIVNSLANDRIQNLEIEGYGPEILSFVLDSLEPNVISGRDRTDLVAVVKELGAEQDVPVLLDILGLITETLLRKSNRDSAFRQQQDQSDRNSIQAIHGAMEKLTGIANPKIDEVERVEFWREWWNENAERVMTGT